MSRVWSHTIKLGRDVVKAVAGSVAQEWHSASSSKTKCKFFATLHFLATPSMHLPQHFWNIKKKSPSNIFATSKNLATPYNFVATKNFTTPSNIFSILSKILCNIRGHFCSNYKYSRLQHVSKSKQHSSKSL